MARISDLLAARHKPNILGYGPSMCGKTRFIASLRKVYKGPCYIFNFDPEDNLMPLILAPGMGDIEYDQYDSPEDGYEKLITKIVAMRKLASEAGRAGGKPFPYDLVCIENGNILQNVILASILRAAKRVDSDGVRIQDWGLAANRVKERIKEIIDLPCPVYVTFHQQIEVDGVLGRTIGRILIPGKFLPDELPPMFNLQLHFLSNPKPGGGTTYSVQCASDATWGAGDKTGSLDSIEEPDFEKMAAKIGVKLAAARAVAASAAAIEAAKPKTT